MAEVQQLSLPGAKPSTRTPRPKKGKRTWEPCPCASARHSLSPAVPEPDLLVIVATNDDMVPTHHVVAVGKDIDGPRA